jgi:predicted N-acetyltransferase YhbS
VKLAALGPPVPITAEHDAALFHCRHESLNDWLRRRALANASSGATRTYVVCAENLRVVGYYALAAGSLDVESAPTRLRRNMPNPLPVVVLGRLAVDDEWSGLGVGGGLLKDAVLRSLHRRRRQGVLCKTWLRRVADARADHDARAAPLTHSARKIPG